MSREIKFRGYSQSIKSMITPITEIASNGLLRSASFHNSSSAAYCTDWVLMQFTGLKDKNGVEIYEGDIISLSVENVVIKFKDGGFGWDSTFVKDDFIGFSGHNHFDSIMSRIEVIGNIHENPELLKIS